MTCTGYHHLGQVGKGFHKTVGGGGRRHPHPSFQSIPLLLIRPIQFLRFFSVPVKLQADMSKLPV
jgi:hypothetical protein